MVPTSSLTGRIYLRLTPHAKNCAPRAQNCPPGSKLRTSGSKLPTSGSKLCISGSKLPTSGSKAQKYACRVPQYAPHSEISRELVSSPSGRRHGRLRRTVPPVENANSWLRLCLTWTTRSAAAFCPLYQKHTHVTLVSIQPCIPSPSLVGAK